MVSCSVRARSKDSFLLVTPTPRVSFESDHFFLKSNWSSIQTKGYNALVAGDQVGLDPEHLVKLIGYSHKDPSELVNAAFPKGVNAKVITAEQLIARDDRGYFLVALEQSQMKIQLEIPKTFQSKWDKTMLLDVEVQETTMKESYASLEINFRIPEELYKPLTDERCMHTMTIMI